MTTPGSSRPAIVYQAVNLVNGKRYIGITIRTLAKRRRTHKNAAKRNVLGCRHFNNAIRHHGFQAFHFSIIAKVSTIEEARVVERELIATHRPEYNITSGGEGSPGHKVSLETRAKIAVSRRGKSSWNAGVPHSEETKQKIRAKAIGRRCPEHVKAMLSDMRTARAVRMRKPVTCLTDGRRFSSLKDACAAVGCNPSAMSQAINGGGGKVRGLTFEYEVAT